jgi:hypothetical protein
LENLLSWSIRYFFVQFFFQGKFKEKEEQLVKVNVSFIIAKDVHLHDVLVCFLLLLDLEFIAFQCYFFFTNASVVKFQILSELFPLAFVVISERFRKRKVEICQGSFMYFDTKVLLCHNNP